uniref:C-type lectin domain-containing protein n=1 Tax=Oreochromis niloticus TaxID=8128 RepID=A0A669E5L1_ORENI
MKLLTVSALLCAMMAMHTVAAGNTPLTTIYSPPAWSHVGCPYGWTRFYRRCFRYIPRRMNWAAAERNCLSMGANLASVHSSREYHLIQRLTAYHGYRVTWIGGHDAPRVLCLPLQYLSFLLSSSPRP